MYRLRIIKAKEDLDLIIDKTNKSISKKIRDAKESQIPILVLGDKEIQHLIDNGLIREWL